MSEIRWKIIVAVFVTLFFLALKIDGDVNFFLNHLFLNRVHLAHEFSFPYFTPSLCGGFLLGADPQNLLFSIFGLLGLLLPNTYFAILISLCISSLIFVFGVARWLKFMGVSSLPARLVAGAWICLSGFWVAHMQVGHLAFHGIIFLPWIMSFAEEFLLAGNSGTQSVWQRSMRLFLCCVPAFFLMSNSGYLWVQVGIPLFLGRWIAAFATKERKQWADQIWLSLALSIAFVAALAMSASRFAGIKLFALDIFPREISIMGVIGSIRILAVQLMRAFFDPRVITQSLAEPHLGGWWEWTAYAGLCSLVFLVVGFASMGRLKKNRVVWGLAIAAVFQLAIMRSTHVAEMLRLLLPPLKGISYYYRGVIVVQFFLLVPFALGFEKMFESGKKIVSGTALAVTGLLALEFLLVYSSRGMMGAPLPEHVAKDFQIPAAYSEPIVPWCYNPIVGYSGEKNHSQTKGQGSSAQPSVSAEHFNLNDVPTLFGAEGKGGKFATEPWPLWPKTNQAGFERFVQFKQVLPSSAEKTLSLAMAASLLAWLIYAALLLRFLWVKR